MLSVSQWMKRNQRVIHSPCVTLSSHLGFLGVTQRQPIQPRGRVQRHLVPPRPPPPSNPRGSSAGVFLLIHLKGGSFLQSFRILAKRGVSSAGRPFISLRILDSPRVTTQVGKLSRESQNRNSSQGSALYLFFPPSFLRIEQAEMKLCFSSGRRRRRWLVAAQPHTGGSRRLTDKKLRSRQVAFGCRSAGVTRVSWSNQNSVL